MHLGEEVLEGWGLERPGEWQIRVDFEKKGMEANLQGAFSSWVAGSWLLALESTKGGTVAAERCALSEDCWEFH